MNISNGQLWKYSSFIENKNYSFSKHEILKNITKEQIDEAYLTISKWDSYNCTPLLQLNKLTKEFSQDGWIIQLDDYKNINDQLLPMKIAMRGQKNWLILKHL